MSTNPYEEPSLLRNLKKNTSSQIIDSRDSQILQSTGFSEKKQARRTEALKSVTSSMNTNKTAHSFPRNSGSRPSRRSQALRGNGASSVNDLRESTENSKQQVVSITYEEIGLFPRSFNRVFDRFFKQLFFDVDHLVIQEYRFYRYLFLTTVQCVFVLLFVPLTINFIAKNYVVRPITEYYWNTSQSEIFLNSYQQKRAFTELQEFEEKIYFESLILTNPLQHNTVPAANQPEIMGWKNSVSDSQLSKTSETWAQNEPTPSASSQSDSRNDSRNDSRSERKKNVKNAKTPSSSTDSLAFTSSFGISASYNKEIFSESVQNRLHEKIIELAIHYNQESIEAITNFFADLISFGTLCYLFFALEIQINITKSFLLEVFFGLDDSKKSLFILFVTDLLVGYHSPNIWELFFSSFFDHYGLPENQTTIFLLVATLPVLLDVLFKYLIFRHLNRASPATVATYHAMIE